VQFGANPVGGLSAYLSRGEVVLELAVSGTPVQYTVVCAAAPCSPGRSFVVHFNIIGFLPDPEDGVSNIADLYVARYGPIPAPSRIFVRTYQHIDGWEDLPKQTTAIVPRR